jgi:hypothetical protein
MKTLLFPLATIVLPTAMLLSQAAANPNFEEGSGLLPDAPLITESDAAIAGTEGQTNATQLNSASPTGATKNMAPTRGEPLPEERLDNSRTENSSASGLTTPGASGGSSLGPGSNSTLGDGVADGLAGEDFTD